MLGSLLSSMNPAPVTWLYRIAFQGTPPDDARTLLIGTVGTTITVVARVFGLTVVALRASAGKDDVSV